MKKSILLFQLCILIFLACTKEKEEKDKSRGSIVEKIFLETLTENQVIAAITPFLGDFARATINNHDVAYYRIIYNTIDPAGNPTIASGLVVIPKNISEPLPLLSYQHGTTLDKKAVGSYKKGEWGVSVILGMKGYVVSSPDYLGLGDGTGLHPYLHAESEATAAIDMMRATRNLCKELDISLNEQVFLMGYSQGGHATMATLKMIEKQNSNEFSITACSAMAGPYDLSGTTLNFVMREAEHPSPAYLPYIIFSYNNIYRMYEDLGTIFNPGYYEDFMYYFNDNPAYAIDEVNELWPLSKIPSVVLKPEIVESINTNPNDPLKLALQDNDLYDWAPKSPLILCHCESDIHVPYQNSEIAYNSFINNGSVNVSLVCPLRIGNHITCTVPSYIYTLLWFNSLKE